MCANLDSAYFLLLDHYLTCGWEAPPVPPPHEYFPAMVAMHPGALSTCNKITTPYSSITCAAPLLVHASSPPL